MRTRRLNESTGIVLTDPDIRARFAALSSTADLASLLGVTYNRLTWHIWRRPQSLRYSKFNIKKRRGGVRLITAPTGGLKIIQGKLARVLRAVYAPGDSTHGFVAGKSIFTNASQHVGRKFVLNVDIQDFFPSIHFGRVRGMFMSWPYNRPEPVATALAQICFAGESNLPQGAPTSPIVANMICAKMDAQFSRLAQKHRCTYTRYSDDLTFSTTRTRFPRELATSDAGELQLHLIETIVVNSGFRVHPGKQRLQSRFDRQEITGLVSNEFVNVRRSFVRQIRSMIHSLEKYGLAKAEGEFRERWDTKHRRNLSQPVSFVEVLCGKLAFLAMIRGRQDRLYSNLVHRARRLHPRFAAIMTRDDAVVVIQRQLEALMKDDIASQGTGFLAEGIGLVTARHVVFGDDGLPLTHMDIFRTHAPQDAVAVECVLEDADLDIAVARVPFTHLPALRVGDPASVRRGDVVTVLGFPQWSDGHTLQETTARVTGKSPWMGFERIHFDVPIRPGTSGGPALNSRGEVIGIAVTGSDTGAHPNALVPISVIAELARQKSRVLPVDPVA